MSNVTVTVNQANVTVDEANSNVAVTTTQSNILVATLPIISNAIIRAAISVTDTGGDGSLAYDFTNGVFTYTGPSASEVRSHFSATAPVEYSSSTGVISIDSNAVFSGKTTDDLAEGSTNLYWTTARGNSNFDTRLATKSTSDLSEGTNLYYTDARVQTKAASLTGNVTTTANVNAASFVTTGNATVGLDLNVLGNLEVTGNINYREVEDLLVRDQTITMNFGNASANDVQLISDRSGSGLANTDLKWNETTDRWQFTNDGTTYYNMAESTTDVAEGTNLYFTSDRANSNVEAHYASGNATSNITTSANLSIFSTAAAKLIIDTTSTVSDFDDGTYMAITDGNGSGALRFGDYRDSNASRGYGQVSYRDSDNSMLITTEGVTQAKFTSTTTAQIGASDVFRADAANIYFPNGNINMDGNINSGPLYVTGDSTFVNKLNVLGNVGVQGKFDSVNIADSKITLNSGSTIPNDIFFNVDFDNVDITTNVEIISYDNIESTVGGLAVDFNNDGTKMFLTGDIGATPAKGIVNEYSLSTPYNVSTSSYTANVVTTSVVTEISGITFNADGTKMYLAGTSDDGDVVQYSLSTAFDVTTATYDNSAYDGGIGYTPQDVKFNSDGTRFWVLDGGSAKNVEQVDIAVANAGNISFGTDGGSFYVGTENFTPEGFDFSTDGTKLLVADRQTGNVFQYSMSTAFDVTTASYDSKEFDGNEGSNLRNMVLAGDSKMFLVDNSNVYQYSYGHDPYIKWNDTAEDWEIYDGTTVFKVPTSTTDLAEGTNLYFTDARAQAALSVTTTAASGDGALAYDNTSGVFTFTPADSEASEYGDSNVVTLLSAFGSNPISSTANITTTANVSTGNLTVGNPYQSSVITVEGVNHNTVINGSTAQTSYIKGNDPTGLTIHGQSNANITGGTTVLELGRDGGTSPNKITLGNSVFGRGSITMEAGDAANTTTVSLGYTGFTVNAGNSATAPFVVRAGHSGANNTANGETIQSGPVVLGSRWGLSDTLNSNISIGGGSSSQETDTAGAFTIGFFYTIVSAGTTDFTAIGAADNNVGTTFRATGVGSGSGTATRGVYNSGNVIFGGDSAIGNLNTVPIIFNQTNLYEGGFGEFFWNGNVNLLHGQNIAGGGDVNYRGSLNIGDASSTAKFISDGSFSSNANITTTANVSASHFIGDGSQLTNIPHPADAVTSVNGEVGVVVLDTDDIAEGTTNQYYTDARAQAALSTTTASASGGGSLAYDNTSGVFTFAPAASVTTAINATNVAITDDTSTDAPHYVTLSPAASGNQGLEVSSSKLSFNPSSGVLQTDHISSASAQPLQLKGQTDGIQLDKTIATVESKIFDTDTTGYSVADADLGSENITTINTPRLVAYITTTAGSTTATAGYIYAGASVYIAQEEVGGGFSVPGAWLTGDASLEGAITTPGTTVGLAPWAGGNLSGWAIYDVATASSTTLMSAAGHIVSISGNTVTLSEAALVTGGGTVLLIPGAYSSTQNMGLRITGDSSTAGIPYSYAQTGYNEYDLPETLANVTLDRVSYGNTSTVDMANVVMRHSADIQTGPDSALRVPRAMLIGANASPDLLSVGTNTVLPATSTLGLTVEQDGLTNYGPLETIPQMKVMLNNYKTGSLASQTAYPNWSTFLGQSGNATVDMKFLGAPNFNFKLLGGTKDAFTTTSPGDIPGRITYNIITGTGAAGADQFNPPASITTMVGGAGDPTSMANVDMYFQSTSPFSYRDGTTTASSIPNTFLASQNGTTTIAANQFGKISLRPTRDYGDNATGDTYIDNRYANQLHEYHTFLDAGFSNAIAKSGTIVNIQSKSGQQFGTTTGFNYDSSGDATLRLSTHNTDNTDKSRWDIEANQASGNLSIINSLNGASPTTIMHFDGARVFIDEVLRLQNLTTTEINALASPEAGDTVYNTTLNQICFYNGTAWQKVTSATM